MNPNQPQPEVQSIDRLQASPENPRIITEHEYKSLAASMKKFGDLSNVILNIQTGRLVGGHQRTKVFQTMQNPQVHITQRLETAASDGTVAYGYVVVGDQQWGYREVNWDLDTEESANIAANEIHGQFDMDKLAEITARLSEDARKMTGMAQDKVQKLLKRAGAKDGDKPGRPKVEKWSADQLRPLVREYYVDDEVAYKMTMQFLDYVAESDPNLT